MDNKDVIRTNLKRIREQTGLSQEEFYKKYLLKHAFINPRGKKEVPADSSIQDWMKKLEHGIFPKRIIELLSVYADIGDTSVDSIIGRTTSGGKAKTASDVLSLLFGFDLDETIEIRIEEEKHTLADSDKEYPIKKPYVRFRNRAPFAVDRALCEWNELEHALKNSGVEDGERIVTNWKKSVLSECENIQF